MKTYTTLLFAILSITLNTSIFSQTIFEPKPTMQIPVTFMINKTLVTDVLSITLVYGKAMLLGRKEFGAILTCVKNKINHCIIL
jgi:cytochrome c oxidase assembly protein Cox11